MKAQFSRYILPNFPSDFWCISDHDAHFIKKDGKRTLNK